MTKIKAELLGMPIGTAQGKLRQLILFELICRLKINSCFRCHGKITSVADMSIEHKESWQRASDPVEAFFSMQNIAFSHRSCNYAAAFRPHKKTRTVEETRIRWRGLKRRQYTPEKRRAKYQEHGY